MTETSSLDWSLFEIKN